MKKLMLSFLVLCLSGCSLLFYRGEIEHYASWINAKTNKRVTNKNFKFCNEKAIFEVIGRAGVDDDLSSEEFYKTFPILGKCLYEKGYVFKVKHPIVYCYNKPKICKAYRDYMKIDFFAE